MTKDDRSGTCTVCVQWSHSLEGTRGEGGTHSVVEFGNLGPSSSGDASWAPGSMV